MATRRDNPTCVVHLTTAHLGFVAMLYSTRPGRALHMYTWQYTAQRYRTEQEERTNERRLGAHDLLGNNRSETSIPIL
jgi:hypothetical protein